MTACPSLSTVPNTIKPAAFTKIIFKPDEKGEVPNRQNFHDCLSTQVPGMIARRKLG
jgi:hypothetical protein